MTKRLILVCFLLTAPAFGATVFVSQAGGSVSCGVDGTQSTTAIGSVTWTSGNTYKFCGTITSTVTPSANTITIFFETGAGISEPVCPVTGCLNVSGRTGITIDGGVNCGANVTNKASCNGFVSSTANGTVLANHVGNSVGIDIDGTSGLTIQNLMVGPIYVRTSNTDTNTPGQPLPSAVWANAATNLLIQNSTFHDANWNQSFVSGSASSGLTWTNVDIYNSDHCWAIGVTTQTTTNIQVNGCHCHDGANWDDSINNSHHHDGLHLYTTTGTGHVTNVRTYNNTFDGNWGTFNTAAIFEEGPGGGEVSNTVYNNFFGQAGTSFNWNNGFINLGNLAGTNPSVNKFYNNTAIASTSQHAYMWQLAYAVDVRNNVLVTSDTASGVTLNLLGNVTGTVNFNTYANPSGSGGLQIASSNKTLTQWKAAGWDANTPGVGTPPFNLNATTGVPSGSFVGLGTGTNLTGLGITALNSDGIGSARPSSGAWDIGYLNGTSGAPVASISPSSLAFGNQAVSTTSAPRTLTLQNTGTATLNIVSIVKSGTNPGSYGLSSTCSSTLTVSASCTASVTFTPGSAASLPASITFTTNDPINPTQVIPLTGTGVIPVATPCLQFQGGLLIRGGLRVQCP